MTIAQFIVAYAVCWWLVLFMVLPSGAAASPTPEKGHAPSAPANPRLKIKCIWASLLALVPTALIYFVATNAKAEETIYHVGSRGCQHPTRYTPSADVNVHDGYGAGDKQVKSADINPTGKIIDTDAISIPLEIPSQNYVDRAAQRRSAQNAANGVATSDGPTSINGRNVDLSHSFVDVGSIVVKRDGDALLNGQSITKDTLNPEGCEDEK